MVTKSFINRQVSVQPKAFKKDFFQTNNPNYNQTSCRNERSANPIRNQNSNYNHITDGHVEEHNQQKLRSYNSNNNYHGSYKR